MAKCLLQLQAGRGNSGKNEEAVKQPGGRSYRREGETEKLDCSLLGAHWLTGNSGVWYQRIGPEMTLIPVVLTISDKQ